MLICSRVAAEAQQLPRDLEPEPLLHPGHVAEILGAGGSQVGGPVPLLVVGDVGGHDLGRAASLQLEGQEAVVGAHVEAALAADVGPGQALDDRP